MKALAITPGKGDLRLIEIEEPAVTDKKDVKVEILQTGICGTDRAEVNGGRADAPDEENKLVIGHEMFGRVVETGRDVKSVKPGDYAVFTVRRPCSICLPCNLQRSDMCSTGLYSERGIKGLHGYQCQFVVDKEEYIIKVPEEIKSIGVLTEPMSVAEKAIDEAIALQLKRLPGFDAEDWFKSSRVLVAGIGSVGLLAAFILGLKGAEVYGLDIVDENSPRPSILKEMGGKYINGKDVSAENIDDICGEMDMIFEAAGVAKLEFQLIDALGINGIYMLTGIPEDSHPVSISGDELIRQVVLKNQILLGSVNASRRHYEMAVNDLKEAGRKWKGLIEKMITEKVPLEEYKRAFENSSPDEIKTVVEWKAF